MQRTTKRVPLPNNPLFVNPVERGPRVSLTFRHIGTFTSLSPSPSSFAGQKWKCFFWTGRDGQDTRRGVARRTRWRRSRASACGIQRGEPPERVWLVRGLRRAVDMLHFTTSTSESFYGLSLVRVTVSPSCDHFCYPL